MKDKVIWSKNSTHVRARACHQRSHNNACDTRNTPLNPGPSMIGFAERRGMLSLVFSTARTRDVAPLVYMVAHAPHAARERGARP